MNEQIAYNIVVIILMGVLPALSILIGYLGLRLRNTNVILFGFLLLTPSIIIILSLVHNI